ncbi:hypothetical protein [Streptomyces sp. CC224B]|uniref:hypothetical protein n=1 Tax=Streptomyces sp. CC224B TaxID=3044571 RepID=UPI0032C099C0
MARRSTAPTSAYCRCDTSAVPIAREPWNVPAHWCRSTGPPACSSRSAQAMPSSRFGHSSAVATYPALTAWRLLDGQEPCR